MESLTSVGSGSGSTVPVGGSSSVSSHRATLAELAKTVDAMRDRLAAQALDVGLRVDPKTRAVIVEVTELTSGKPIVSFPVQELPRRMPSSQSDPRLLNAQA